jgi:hypothetical protein
MTSITHPVVQDADDAAERIRSINHLTGGGAMPAPLVYDILGNLKNVGHRLPQALEQIAAGLEQSLTEYDLYDGPGKTPADSVAAAAVRLRLAARLAGELGRELDAAQEAINEQGYRIPEDTTSEPDTSGF